MPAVELEKMSGGALSKLRNGHPCRCALAKHAGSGHKVIMGEGKIKDLIKAGKRGAKKTMSLTKEEIEENKIKGTGLMAGGRVRSAIHAEGGKIKVKKVIKKVLKSKPVQAAKKAGMRELASMAEEGLEEAGVPGPVAKASVKAIEKKVDSATGGKLRVKHALKKHHVGRKALNTAKKVAKHPITQEVVGDLGAAAAMALVPEGGPVSGAAGKYAAQQALGMAAGSGLYASGRGLVAGGSFISGGAIGPSSGPESFVRFGSGGNLMGPRNPALRSQPDAANWEFHTQLPPAMASQITGSGLYASGRGLYA